jgi:hypothetical protein
MTDAPNPSVVELLRRDAFDELGRVAMLAEDYALKLFDATERRNPLEVAGRLQQLRFCTMAMIQTFNLILRVKHEQGVAAAEAGSSDAHREDQRSGDVVA